MTPIKAVAIKLAMKDAAVANWYIRLAECAPDISWDDVARLRDFMPRRTPISLAVKMAFA